MTKTSFDPDHNIPNDIIPVSIENAMTNFGYKSAKEVLDCLIELFGTDAIIDYCMSNVES